jgi:hypothetical protein
VDVDFEMRAVEVKGKDPRCAWEIVGIYRAQNEDMRVLERLATRAHNIGNFTKSSIIAGDLNGNVECTTVGGVEGAGICK